MMITATVSVVVTASVPAATPLLMLLPVMITVVSSAVVIPMMMMMMVVTSMVLVTMIIRPVAMMMIVSLVMMMHGVPVPPCVVREHGGTFGLLDDIRGPTPEDNGDAALAVLLVLGQGINTVLPVDVHVPPEGEEHPVGLREVDLFPGLSIKESQLPSLAKGHTHSDVLILGSLRVEGCAIVMEGLPVGGVGIPVETRAHTFHFNVKIVGYLFFDHLEGGGGARVLRN
jgi:hypothetical protein